MCTVIFFLFVFFPTLFIFVNVLMKSDSNPNPHTHKQQWDWRPKKSTENHCSFFFTSLKSLWMDFPKVILPCPWHTPTPPHRHTLTHKHIVENSNRSTLVTPESSNDPLETFYFIKTVSTKLPVLTTESKWNLHGAILRLTYFRVLFSTVRFALFLNAR